MRQPAIALIGFVFASWLVSAQGLARADDDELAKAKTATITQMRELVLGLLYHHDTFKRFPAPALVDKEDKPLLSWRVRLLPFIGQADLYSEFHLDEAWDSEHNKALIPKMPALYKCPRSKLGDDYRTVYLVPSGEETMFPGPKGLNLRSILDGTSRTIAVIEVDDEHAVVWSRPEDWKFDPADPTAGLGAISPTSLWRPPPMAACTRCP